MQPKVFIRLNDMNVGVFIVHNDTYSRTTLSVVCSKTPNGCLSLHTHRYFTQAPLRWDIRPVNCSGVGGGEWITMSREPWRRSLRPGTGSTALDSTVKWPTWHLGPRRPGGNRAIGWETVQKVAAGDWCPSLITPSLLHLARLGHQHALTFRLEIHSPPPLQFTV